MTKQVKKYIIPEDETIIVPRFNEANGFYTTARSSANKQNIKSRNNKEELKLRKALWSTGIRYRLYYKHLPGKPDLVFIRKKVAVFVDGEFWHGKNWEQQKEKIKSNRNFWIPKIERNMQRDREVTKALERMGWKVIRIWDIEINKNLGKCVLKILAALQ